MRVCLATPPKNIHRSDSTKPTVCTQPLGIAYLAAVLEEKGEVVKIIDGYSLGLSSEKIQQEITHFKPDVIGISSYTINIYDAYEVARLSKAVCPSVRVIIGGPHATALPEEVVSNEHVDVAFIGEAEDTIHQLCCQLMENKSALSVPNVCHKSNGQTRRNDKAFPPVDIDRLPFPAHHLLPGIDLYNPYPHWGKTGRFSSLITSRGCPYNCMFCSVTSAQGRKYRGRSAQSIVGEIKMLSSELGVSTLSFRDGTVGTSRERLLALCEELIASDVKVEWNCTIRTNEIDENVARRMKQAGCSAAQLGIEVGNPEMLKEIKNLTPEQVEKAVLTMANEGIRVHGYFMFGLPGETEKTIQETIRFACKLSLYSAGFSIAVPYPGTRFFQYCEENQLLTTRQWDLYDTGKMVFRHPNLADEQIIRAQKKAFRRFYLRPRTAARIIRRTSSLADVKNFLHLGWNFILK